MDLFNDIPLHNLPQHLVQTSLLRALAPTTPTYLFPAMNTFMYEHPLTNLHIRTIKDVIHYEVIGPIGKNLACGDTGTSIYSPGLSLGKRFLYNI